MINASNAGRKVEPSGEHRPTQRVRAGAAHGLDGGRRRVLTFASIVSVLASVLTVATHPLSVRAALYDVNPFAGTGSWGYSGDGGPATAADLDQPDGVAEDSTGNVYIADLGNNRIRKVDTSGNISTYAGNGTGGFSGDGGSALAAELNQPYWLSFDAAGDLLISDQGNNRIRAVSPSGTITTVAGNGTAGYAGDGGAATSAEINSAQSVRGLSGGGFLIGDTNNNVVRKVDASGTITTIAGNGTGGFAGDGGPATSAELSSPQDAGYDPAGNLIITDCNNERVRKVDTSGNISTIAGNGTGGFSGDGGPATSAEFSCPVGVAFSAGSMYVSDYGNGAIRKIDGSGTVTTVAGQGAGNINTFFNRVGEVLLDNSGRLIFTDWWDARVWAQSVADLLSLSNSAPVAVTPGQTYAYTLTVANPGGVGPATGVTLSDPLPAGVTFGSVTTSAGTCSQSGGTVTCALGTLAVGSFDTVTITVTAPNGTVQLSNTATVTANETDPAPSDNTATALTGVNATDLSISAAGSPGIVGAGGGLTYTLGVGNAGPNVTATGVTVTDALPAGASFQTATASQGSCTQSGGTVTCALGSLAVGATATVTIVIAAPTSGSAATDQATVSAVNPDWNPSNNSATVQTTVLSPGTILNVPEHQGNGVYGVAEDSAGNVYMALYFSNNIAKVDPSGNTSDYAGCSCWSSGYTGDGGPAASATLRNPTWVSFDAAGDMLIADQGNNVIRAVSPSGTITTVAGTGTAGYSGDGGPATSAQLNQPYTVTGLAGGGFLIADIGNDVVRKVDASGKITTIVGNGTTGYTGDGGPATSAELNEPLSPIMDASGDVFVSDCNNNVVREIDPTGKISTVAGTGAQGFSGDGGSAAGAQLNCPYGLALWAGSLYVADYGNGAVRRIDPAGNISTVLGQGVGQNFSHMSEVWPDAAGHLYFTNPDDNIEAWLLSLGPDLLSVTGSAPAGVALGQTFSYTETVGNVGGQGTATGVTLSDPLPAGLTYVSATASSGTCSQSGGTVTCGLGQIAPGAAATATITVTAPATGSGSMVNTATVSADQTDITPGNNTSTTTTVLNAADMSVRGLGSPSQVPAWSSATHTFLVSSGGSNAPSATLNATISANAGVQSVSTSQGSCTSSSTTVSCQLGTLGPGATATVSITVVPSTTSPFAIDTATAASALTDPNPGNNAATVQTAVTGAFGDISTFAGGGGGGDGGPATSASLSYPAGVVGDSAGNVYIAELYGNRVRKVDPSGTITTYAGTGNAGHSGDGGPATSATLNQPFWLSLDAAGNLLVSELGNNVIRSINPKTGIITTVAGNGTAGYTGDGGPATSAELNNPQSVRGLPGGGFLIGDTSNNVVRKVDASGKITTIAGNGTGGYAGDGGPATTAEFNGTQDAALDPAGDLIIADCGNARIRRVDATTGIVSTIAGTGNSGYSGDGGPATGAQLNCPEGLALAGGDIYFSDYGNNVVRRIDPSGSITTVAGNGSVAYPWNPNNGDGGPATGAGFYRTNELWFDPSANMYIGDFAGRIRKVSTIGPDLLNVAGSAPSFVGSGKQFSYTFDVTNPGTVGAATGVTLSDPLPSGVTFVSATTTRGSCTASSGTVTCAIGSLGALEYAVVTITVTAQTAPTDATNTATVSANETDPTLGDNTASVVNHLGEVDVSISQTGPKPALEPLNTQVTFSMTIGSHGSATGVTLKDPLPSSLKYVSATPSQGSCAAASGTVTCPLGAIADGGSATVTLKVTTVAAPGKITNTATVSASQPDVNPANNTASAIVYVNPAACGEVITASTTLTADVGPCWGDGVVIGADNITLNLNGHSIIGDALQLDDMAGIRVPVRNFVTIENGTVTGFDDGIFVNSGGGNTIQNMNVHDNIGPSSNPNGQGGFADFGDGILLQHSASNKILNSTILHNGTYDGIGLFGLDTNFNLIQGNTISKGTNGADGIALSAFLELYDPRRSQSLYENNIIGNTIDDNDAAGITSVANVGGLYLNNDIERNGSDTNSYPLNGIGLQPERSSTTDLNDTVENNKVIGNGQNGIQTLQQASGSLIKNNTVEANNADHTSYSFDLNDYSFSDCSLNVWTGNTYSASGGVNPSCLASTNTLASASAPAASASPQAATKAKPGRPDASRLPRGRVDPGVQPQGSAKVPSPAAAPAKPPSTAPTCGSVVTASITLTADLGPCSGPGLIAGADNITINLGGHKITGSGVFDGMSPGVYVFAHQGVTVTNGDISNFDAGVGVYESANDTISKLNIHDNIGPTDPVGTLFYQYPTLFPTPEMSDGIGIYHSFNVTVANNTLTHNGNHAGIGVYGDDTNANTVKNNTVTNTVGSGLFFGVGIDVTAAFESNDDRPYLPIEGNTVFANTVTGSQGAGIVSLGNTNALIKANVVQNNGVSTSTSPRDGIQINFNSAGGASPRTVDTVLGNTVSGSGDNGIAVFSGGNTIQGNTATGDNVNNDGSFDLFDSHPGCDHNTWHGNTSGSAGVSPSCA